MHEYLFPPFLIRVQIFHSKLYIATAGEVRGSRMCLNIVCLLCLTGLVFHIQVAQRLWCPGGLENCSVYFTTPGTCRYSWRQVTIKHQIAKQGMPFIAFEDAVLKTRAFPVQIPQKIPQWRRITRKITIRNRDSFAGLIFLMFSSGCRNWSVQITLENIRMYPAGLPESQNDVRH